MRKLAVVSFASALHVDRRRKQEAARDEPVGRSVEARQPPQSSTEEPRGQGRRGDRNGQTLPLMNTDDTDRSEL